MKIKFFKRCAAAILAVSVLSMGIMASAAESSAVAHGGAQTISGDLASTPSETMQVPYDQYLSALLDVYYRNDSRAFVALGLGTAEEATMLYNAVLDTELLSMELESVLGMECPEALENEFRALMAQLLGGARYAVAGCELQADGTYKVTIVYEQMIIFEPLMKLYMAVVTDLATTWLSDYSSMPSEEDMMIQILAALCSCTRVCLDNVTYAAPALTYVSIEPQNGTYLPNIDDIFNLEAILFDTNALN